MLFRFLMPENSSYLLRKETVYMIANLMLNNSEIIEVFVTEISVMYQVFFDIEENPGSIFGAECLGVVESFLSEAEDGQVLRLLNEYGERFFVAIVEN